MDKRPALGKGLSALIPDAPEPRDARRSKSTSIGSRPNAFQPRAPDGRCAARRPGARRSSRTASFSRSSSARSATAFRSSPASAGGARRRRPACSRVPVVVREVAPGQERSLLEMALIENIQRENLNPIDEALAYRRLTDEFHLTQDDIAAAVGKDRATVANFLRLLKLPDEVRAEVAVGTLSMGHARALLALPTKPISGASRATSSRAACRCAKPSRWSRSIVERRGRRRARSRRPRRRRPHARRRGPAAPRARHPRPHRPARRARADRDRLRVGRRADPDLRAADGELRTWKSRTRRPRATRARGVRRTVLLSLSSSSKFRRSRSSWYKLRVRRL